MRSLDSAGLHSQVLTRAVHLIRELPPDKLPSVPLLTAMAMAWGNPGYSATIRLLRRICRNMAKPDARAVLECGSGSSSILVGLFAEKLGRRVYSLEHHAGWVEHMRGVLDHFGITSVEVLHAPLRCYGDFEWYTMPEKVAAENYSFVVCDGPPKSTRGGRVGLLPVLTDRLTDDCVILLDDTHRRSERRIVREWHRQRPLLATSFVAAKGFSEIAFV